MASTPAIAPLIGLAAIANRLAQAAYEVHALRTVTGPWLARSHRWLTRLEKQKYRGEFPQVQIVHYSRAALRANEAKGYRAQAGQDHHVHQTCFRDRSAPGFYVDVGANAPVRFSNTCFFDRALSWRGLALDPLGVYREAWARERTAEFLLCAASDSEGALEFDEVLAADAHADALSAVRGASVKHEGFKSIGRRVPARPLTALLAERGVVHVDFMSIDVEGHELQVLRGLDFTRVTVDVLVIENNEPPLWGSDAIREHMAANGFKHHSRIWLLDDVFVRTASGLGA